MPLSKTGAELLFELISQRYERGSILITSNLPFDEWTETFGSERLTGALLDRLTHHVSILEMTLGADKGYDAAEFVADLRQACVTPHVARKARHSAIDGRTTRHKGYALSQKHRKRIEEAFGWAKTVGGMSQTVYRGVERVRSRFILTLAAGNLARLPRLLAE